MFLKRRRRYKDGKDHVYYSVCESLRVHGGRTVQRQVLHLGELNTTQLDSWQRTLEVVHEDGSRHQRRLFTDRESGANGAEDVIEVKLDSFTVKKPRRFGDCWVGCRAWEELGLGAFWRERLREQAGDVPWQKVLELLAVNRLLAPKSELFVHEKWFGQTAMDILLDTDARVAGKDRLYRCLDRIVEHKEALEQHLAHRWRELFGANFEVLLYDLTSTYFEGKAVGVNSAARGYSRDHRPDCLQIVIALIVSTEGLPLSYEVFGGNRLDVTTLKEILEAVEKKYGQAKRVWVFDRGIVSEENLRLLRERGAHYLVGTPRRQLKAYEKQLLEGGWEKASSEVEVKLVAEHDEVYVVCRSQARRAKEKAMRWRALRALVGDLRALRRRVSRGQIKDAALIQQAIGRLAERHHRVWRWVAVRLTDGVLSWSWDREGFARQVKTEGAYLLRAHLSERDPAKLWQTYMQLTEAEAAFRTLKSEIKLRPIWHWVELRVQAHVMVAFLGYCLWVYVKKNCQRIAPGLTPWALLDQLGRMLLVEVWFETRDGRWLCLPRITEPEAAEQALLRQLGWHLPTQPPPRVHQSQVPNSAVH
jgi:transposase